MRGGLPDCGDDTCAWRSGFAGLFQRMAAGSMVQDGMSVRNAEFGAEHIADCHLLARCNASPRQRAIAQESLLSQNLPDDHHAHEEPAHVGETVWHDAIKPLDHSSPMPPAWPLADWRGAARSIRIQRLREKTST
jgi:hypothetical protein